MGGAYFITICTQGKKCLFGEVVDGEMRLNEAGRLVQQAWFALAQRFNTLVLDAFQVMPNHLHAVFVLPGPGLEPALAAATGAPIIQPTAQNFVGAGFAVPKNAVGVGLAPPASGKMGTANRAPTMGDVVGAFKSICTIEVNRILSRTGTRLLQRNFYENAGWKTLRIRTRRRGKARLARVWEKGHGKPCPYNRESRHRGHGKPCPYGRKIRGP